MIKDERTCYNFGTRGHKIKCCESQLSILIAYKENLKHTRTAVYHEGILNSEKHQNKRRTNRQKRDSGLFLKIEAQKSILEIKWYEGSNAEVYRHVYNKNSSSKIKHNRDTKRKTEKN